MRNARENQLQSFYDAREAAANKAYDAMQLELIKGAQKLAELSFDLICEYGFNYCIENCIVKNEQNFYMGLIEK